MKISIILTFCIFLCLSNLYSQKEFNNWYFGNRAGITFNTPNGEPEALLDGEIVTNEGCSVISDKNGSLLFYTDGVSVWNRKHQIMKNGTDLYGNHSSTQSALIVPKPNSKNIYYIFTSDAFENKYLNGFNYSIVDMNLDTGAGAITKKNEHILNNKSEKVAAFTNEEGSDIWVVTQDIPKQCFAVYLLNVNGLNTNPIISPFKFYTNNFEAGMLKISPNGKKLAMTSSSQGYVYIYDFNFSTGEITNELVIKSNVYNKSHTYGLEFSENGRYLYYTSSNSNYTSSYLHQIDLSSNIANEIMESEIIITQNNIGLDYCSLQIGPNKKIYMVIFVKDISVNNGKDISVIHNPNLSGSLCNFELNGCSLEGRIQSVGLPSVVQNYKSKNKGQDTITFCVRDTIFLYSLYYKNAEYEWTGPNGFYSNKYFNEIIDIKPEMSGTYKYKITKDGLTIMEDSVIVIIKKREKILFSDKKEIIIIGKTYNLKAVENPDESLITWSGIQSNENEIIITKTGHYKVVVENENGCKDSASIYIEMYPSYCEGDSIILNTFYKVPDSRYNATFFWSGPKGFSSTDEIPIITDAQKDMSGDYIARIIVKIGTGDFGGEIDTLYMTVPVLVSPREKILFAGQKIMNICADSLELTAVNNPVGCDISWKGIDSKENTVVIKKSGNYTAYVENENGCKDSVTVYVKLIDAPKLEIHGNSLICNNEPTTLSPNFDFTEYLWSTGETTKEILVDKGGYYYLKTFNENGCTDSAYINILKFGENISIYEKQHAYGIVKAGNMSEFKFTIENNEAQELTVQNIYIKNQPVHFELQHNELPFVIKPNEKTEIKVNFIPKFDVNIADSVVLIFSEPCNITDYVTLSGRGEGEILVDIWMPDTTADIGTANFKIPLYVKLLDNGNAEFVTDISAKIGFLRTLYNAKSLSLGQYLVETLQDSLIYNVEFKDVLVSNKTNKFSEFIGDILFAKENFTEMKFDKLKFSNPYFTINYKNGLIKLNEICIPEIKGIKVREGTFLSLKSDNINGTMAKAYCGEAGEYSFTVYSVTGETIYKDSWTTNSKSEKYYKLSDLVKSSGLYFILLNSGKETDVKNVTIIK